MYTDLSGFTRLTQADEPLALRLIEEQEALIRPTVEAHHGRQVKSMGDGLLIEPSPALRERHPNPGPKDRCRQATFPGYPLYAGATYRTARNHRFRLKQGAYTNPRANTGRFRGSRRRDRILPLISMGSLAQSWLENPLPQSRYLGRESSRARLPSSPGRAGEWAEGSLGSWVRPGPRSTLRVERSGDRRVDRESPERFTTPRRR